MSYGGKATASFHLFLPKRYTRPAILKWLRRTHAWFALWGGVAGMLFGATGILLNHRAVMKIPAVQTQVSNLQLPLAGYVPQSPEALALWLQRQLNVATQGHTSLELAHQVEWGDRSVIQPERWEVVFSNPGGNINAAYWRGDTSVGIKRRDGNAFYLLARLHMAQGVHPGWILLADSIAGSLIVLSVTGLLLWSRFHGGRLLALGLLGTCFGGPTAFALLSM
jgi:hypothetical protein